MTKNPARTAAVIGAVILLLATAIAWFALIGPRVQTASNITAEAEQQDLSNLQLRNRYNQALDKVAQAPEAAAEAQKLFATMPEAAELPTVLRQISDAAVRAGIDPASIETITTSVPVPLDASGSAPAGVNLASMDIGITVSGARPDLLAFVDNLQDLDRALLITGTQFLRTPPAEGVKKTTENLQVSGTMFVLQSTLPDLVADVEKLIEEAKTKQAAAAR